MPASQKIKDAILAALERSGPMRELGGLYLVCGAADEKQWDCVDEAIRELESAGRIRLRDGDWDLVR